MTMTTMTKDYHLNPPNDNIQSPDETQLKIVNNGINSITQYETLKQKSVLPTQIFLILTQKYIIIFKTTPRIGTWTCHYTD